MSERERYDRGVYEPGSDEELERLWRSAEADGYDAARDYRPIHPEPAWRSLLRKLWAPIAIGVGLVLKFGAATFKFLGVFISVAGYALIWGWKFAVGFVALIFVHEMGHYLEARRQGLHPSAPVFIPFLGAYVAIKDAPRDDPWRNALISLAGPALGGIGAAVTWLLGETLDSRFLLALAFSAFLINLINLAPVAFLDGGFAWRSLRALWARPRRDPSSLALPPVQRGRALVVGAYYLGLAGIFVLALLETHVPQDRI